MTFRFKFDKNRRVGYETSKSYVKRWQSGFWTEWIRGPNVVDIGYRGGTPDALPLFDGVHGIELGDYGYDGLNIPLRDGWADVVHASHVLEHVGAPEQYLQEWFRVLGVGGYMLLFLPHAYLYERRLTVPPSRWSGEHLMAVTPGSLLSLIERALAPNTYRVRHLADNDRGYDYGLSIEQHPIGGLEIECVIEKIDPPAWDVEG